MMLIAAMYYHVNIILKNSCIIFLRNRSAWKQEIADFNLTNVKDNGAKNSLFRNC